jgi:hypothetical protein
MSFESQGAPSESSAPPGSRRPPFFFREEYSNLIVKGNFMTLAAKPKFVEEGEWLAHTGEPQLPQDCGVKIDHVTSR